MRRARVGRLTAANLAAAIRAAVEDPSMRAGAETLGEALRLEDGVTRAARMIERFSAGQTASGFNAAL
jgi:sterol 3beta-glucosyltransferase